jgi:predicted P-loop ATPase
MTAKKSIATKLATKLASKVLNTTTNKLVNTGANRFLEMVGLSSTPKKLMPHELQSLLEESDDSFSLNTFTGRQTINGNPVNEISLTQLKNKLSAEHNIRITKTDLREAVQVACYANLMSPVQEYLTGLSWDGKDCIPALAATLKPKCDDARHEALVRRMLECFVIGSVARVMEPGTKHDDVLVLRGAQRGGKSTTFQTLASSPWFRDSHFDIESRDGLQCLQACWIYELSELRQLKDKDPATTKAFLSSQSDTYRAPWARLPESFPRAVLFCATTNAERFLTDSTGSSRFHVLETLATPSNPIDIKAIAAMRDQVWAQAVSLYNQGRTHWLNAEDTILSEAINARYAVEMK